MSAPGFVDSLDEAYRNAAFTIAPIHSGGGTNIKILESLAYGRACVTTPHSADAFQMDLAGSGLGIAEADTQFAEQCVAWLDDIDNRGQHAAEAWSKIEKLYTRPRFIERATRLCSSLL